MSKFISPLALPVNLNFRALIARGIETKLIKAQLLKIPNVVENIMIEYEEHKTMK